MRWNVLLLVGVGLAVGSQLDDTTIDNAAGAAALPKRRVVTRPLKYGLMVANPDDDDERRGQGNEDEDGRRLSNNGAYQKEDNFQPPIEDDGVEELLPPAGAVADEDDSEYAARRQRQNKRRAAQMQQENGAYYRNNDKLPPRRSPRSNNSYRDDERFGNKRGADVLYKAPVDLDVNEANDGEPVPPLDSVGGNENQQLKADKMTIWSSRMGPIGAAGAGLAVVFGLGACCIRGRKKKVLPLTTHDAFGGRHMAKRA